jgi:polysaccharide deacetylase family protein (PEP-CTERM system associated)
MCLACEGFIVDNLGSAVANEAPSAVLNSITVDVEDYFQTEAMASTIPKEQWDRMPSRVVQNTERIFELLASYGVRGTFFFLGWVAERFPDLVRQAMRLGHELGCHSYWHRLVYRLNPEEFSEDTKRAKGAVEDAAGIPVLGYRAPSFSMIKDTEWAQEILAGLGFTYDSSVCPVNHDLYNNPNAPRAPHRIAGGALEEFPVATISIGGRNFPVGGGGYLRMLPYAYTRLGLLHLNNKEHFRAILYVHPWEVDPEQPRIATRLRSRLRQYTGLKTTAGKMERLLSDFRFAPIAESFAVEIANNLNQKVRPDADQSSIPIDQQAQQVVHRPGHPPDYPR